MNDNTEVKIEETTEKQFSMTLSGGEEVISLGRDVVRGLNVPSFIKILVSENYDEIVFTPCAEKEHMSFKVPEKVFTQHSGMLCTAKPLFMMCLSETALIRPRHTISKADISTSKRTP